jgi:hypothetical protein
MVFFVDCGRCAKDRECDSGKKGETHRKLLADYVKGEPAGCPGYDPQSYHGIEGVAA